MIKTEGRILKCLAAPIVLVVYLLVYVEFSLFHSFTHGCEEAELHSPHHEVNPCHLSIYHGGGAQGCDHRNHLVPKQNDCSLCKAAIQREVSFKDVDDINFIRSFFSWQCPHPCLYHGTQPLSGRHSRAPPFFVQASLG